MPRGESEVVFKERELIKGGTMTMRVVVRRDWRVRFGFWVALAGLKLGSALAGFAVRVESE